MRGIFGPHYGFFLNLKETGGERQSNALHFLSNPEPRAELWPPSGAFRVWEQRREAAHRSEP